MVPVLVLISGDPRTSPRPAEAIRIAAGVGGWGKVAVTIYLRGEAIRTLGAEGEDLMNGEELAGCWPLVKSWNRPVRVQAGAEQLAGLGEPPVPLEPITDQDLARLAAAQRYVLRF